MGGLVEKGVFVSGMGWDEWCLCVVLRLCVGVCHKQDVVQCVESEPSVIL